MNQVTVSPRGSGGCSGGGGRAVPVGLVRGLAGGLRGSLLLLLGARRWGDVTDRLMEAHRVVLGPDTGQLGFEDDGVLDVFEVGPLALDVAEEALDPALVGRGVRPAVVLD